jgi:hypothetical protein
MKMRTLENRQFVDQKTRAVLELVEQRSAMFAKQGIVVESWRTYQGRQLGPYYRLAFREGKRQCSIYLGASKERARRVQTFLDRLQKRTKMTSVLNRARAGAMVELRAHKELLDEQLRERGLYLKGFEVRGWSEVPAQ